MPAKKNTGSGDFLGKLRDFVMENVVTKLDRIINDAALINSIMSRLDEMKKKFMRALIAFAIILIGFVFLMVGIAQYLSTILGMFTGDGYVTVGIVIIIIGLIYKAMKH